MKSKRLFSYALAILLFAGFNPELLAQEDGEDYVDFGGAMRYNIIWTDYIGPSDDNSTNPSFTWDTWRLNVDGRTNGIDLSFEYRFYPTFGTHFIHHGFLGYGLTDDLYMELGVTQVPFGITTYASHSWWFQGAYYVGLEDDYDMGVNFDYTGVNNLKLSFSYFRQQEPEGPIFGGDVTFGGAGSGRYSYDIVSDGANGLALRELNQFNTRAAYNITEGLEVGGSFQIGQIYNVTVDQAEWSPAYALHAVYNNTGWNVKAQFGGYEYNAVDNNGNDLATVPMGAYGFAYPVASKSMFYMIGVAKSFSVDWGPITSIQPYIDYTLIDKNEEAFYDTHHLVPGFLISAGSIYTYVDFAMGKNQPWLTNSFGSGLGAGTAASDDEWQTRFNINIGYYF